MRYLKDLPFTRECLGLIDPDSFPLSFKCAKQFIDTEGIVIRFLISQEVTHPLAIMIFEERTSENIHVYSLEVHPNNRCESVGRKMIDRLKEDHNYIDLTTLPESKIFYEKRRFVEEEDGHMVWRKPRLT